MPPAEISLGAGGVFRAGEEISLAWPALPPDTKEFELLLLCETPLRLKVRLTESRSPETTRFTWRVPAFPAGRARLLLRRGGRGGETTWAVSPSFEIQAALGQQVQRVAWRSGELWLSEERAPSTLESRIPPALSPGGERLPAVLLEGGDASPLPPVATSPLPEGDGLRVAARPYSAVPRSALPLQIPLRI